MIIRIGYQNAADMKAAQWSLNAVKTIKCEMGKCDGDHEAVACTKEHSRLFHCFCTSEVIGNFQEKVIDDLAKRMLALAL